jgi:two-component system, response regulator PdtaR
MDTLSSVEPPSSQLALLHRVSNIVSSDRSLDEMLGELIGLAVQVTDCDACLVYLWEAESAEIVLAASQVPHAGEIGNLRLKIGEGITGWVAEHKSVVALSYNASLDRRFKHFQGLVEDTYEAFLSVPLVAGGDLIGVINVHHRESHVHSPEEVTLLTFVGEQMGGAIVKSRLSVQNQKLLEETTELKKQLESRKLVERAKGILQHRHSLTEEEAYLRLRNESRRMRRPMRDLAEAIILAEELSRSGKEGRPEFSVAVQAPGSGQDLPGDASSFATPLDNSEVA